MLHKRLQTLRKQKGFSQKDMADKLHKSPSAYSRMESGDIKITLEELPAIAEILGCTANDLLSEMGTINIQQHNEEAHAYTAEIQTINNGSEEMVKQLEALVKQVIDHQAKSEERMQVFMKTLLEALKK
jgi:transcriptional regulator with XRE-family HTH domain